VLLVSALLALVIAAGSWLWTSREIDQLERDVAVLQDAYRELAQARGGPAGQVIDVAGAPALGPPDAVVTLVEFSDYECPFCIRHFQETMPRIREDYIESGRIRYVFRDFPIEQNHPEAIRAHEAGHCAQEQQRFWDLHPKLFGAPGTHTQTALEERAREAGLDEARFRSCLASGRTTPGVREIAEVATALGATGTPWFFVGLRDLAADEVRVLFPLGGAQPYEQFALALDAALRQAAAN
jgi:protein-disulfide isomerase